MIRTRFTALLISATLLLPLSATAETTEAQTLSDLMSADEIQAMGLDQLSEKQRAQLMQWILRHSATATSEAEQPASAAPLVGASQVQEASVTATPEPAGKPAPTATAVAAAGPATAPAPVENYDTFGKSPPRSDEMHSRIVGSFEGWSGATRFELENGQVWQQRYETTWRTNMDNPEVIIRRHMLGLHRMEVVGTGKSVPVKRLK